jgi:enolase-phosphatase E1
MTQTISHVLLDIEGTTCPVSFVSGTLFPYAARELGPYLERHHHNEIVQSHVLAVIEAWRQESDPQARELWNQARERVSDEAGASATNQFRGSAIEPYLQWLIAADRKFTPLKELQGMVWAEGYARGELVGDLFEEVPDILRDWHQQGLVLAVYSSGSIAAQKLLYGHSQAGDLGPLFSHWFDTHSGGKHEVDSYKRICATMGVEPQQVLFISDSEAELQAAATAQLQVVLSDRDHTQPPEQQTRIQDSTTPPVPKGRHSITNLGQLKLNAAPFKN